MQYFLINYFKDVFFINYIYRMQIIIIIYKDENIKLINLL